MRKNINTILYDTENATLIAEAENMTTLAGNICIKLFMTPEGNWFQTIEPESGTTRQLLKSSETLDPETARRWLEKRSFNRQIREYFSNMGDRLKPERAVIVAEWKSTKPTKPLDCMQVERLYYHPQRGWKLKQTKEPALIPLTANDAARLAKTLQFEQGHVQSSLPFKKEYLRGDSHIDHREITL